ncbi:hypothetical protein KC19_VG195100 [Ceratodon purpureus]|uniref:Uncharacterized protein n=1 Tax=Ceratodon purpureus TaxID=3225 RepID=A0A8T0HRL7_CERPU|nr:hypothetical protein KC19_VG195100 [Ceratodon purpureus]
MIWRNRGFMPCPIKSLKLQIYMSVCTITPFFSFVARCILEIGPLLLHSYVNDDTIEQEVEERDPNILWLNKHAHQLVLYISFGSWATLIAPQLLELIHICELLSMHLPC